MQIPVILPESGRVWVRRPLNDATYSKHECLHIIKSLTVKGSKDRATIIQFMLDCKFVPHRTGLYKLLLRDEQGLPIGDDNWGIIKVNTPGEDKKSKPIIRGGGAMDLPFWKDTPTTPLAMLPILKDSTQYAFKVNLPPLPLQSKKRRKLREVHNPQQGEYVRFHLRDSRAWKGRLRLAVTPIRYCDYDQMEYEWRHISEKWQTKIANPEHQAIDICDYIGNSDYFQKNQMNERVFRLYFSPTDFEHTQYDELNRQHFVDLKNYIRMASENEGSPVICSVSSKKNGYKTFTCNKNKSGKRKVCPFSFQVRWDRFGFYIHLLPSKNHIHSDGSAWHCCK